MKTALPKPPGRPGTGRDPTVQLRMPLGLINDIESWAAKFEKLDRSAAMRALVALGLRAGRRQNCILDPKGYERHDRGDNVALAASRLIDHDHLAAIRGTAATRPAPPERRRDNTRTTKHINVGVGFPGLGLESLLFWSLQGQFVV